MSHEKQRRGCLIARRRHCRPHTTDTIQAFIGTSHLAGPYNWNYGDFLVSDAVRFGCRVLAVLMRLLRILCQRQMTGGAGCGQFHAGDHCPGQTDAEYRTQFSVYVLVASPLIIGTDIRNMTKIMKDALLNKVGTPT